MMSQRFKTKISDGDSDSSESTLPTDPTFPALVGLSLLDVCEFKYLNNK
jgi:hypothetical protein